MHIFWWSLAGIAVGLATGWIIDRRGLGSPMDALAGVFGAIFLGFVVGYADLLCAGGLLAAILVAAIGAALLTVAVRLLRFGRALR